MRLVRWCVGDYSNLRFASFCWHKEFASNKVHRALMDYKNLEEITLCFLHSLLMYKQFNQIKQWIIMLCLIKITCSAN